MFKYPDGFIALLKSRDQRAWERLSRDTAEPLFKVIRHTLRNASHETSKATCCDILQEAMMSFAKTETLDRIRQDSRIYPYLKAICVFKAFDHIRQNISEERYTVSGGLKEDDPQCTENSFLADPVRESVDIKIMQDLVNKVISALSEREKLIVKFCWQDKMSHAKVSIITGVSRNTISAILKKTKIRITEEINKYDKN